MEYSYISLILALLAAYTFYGAIWRLYLSPIAHIPGPRLAALTRLYEAYYDLLLNGQYTFHLKKLHEQYGPVVRISPWEVHVHDPDFYDTIYAGYSSSRRSNKYPWFTKFLGLDLCVFATVDHELHRKRRSALLPFFSKAGTRRLKPVIQEKINLLLRRLVEFRDKKEVLNASNMFSALTNDVVNIYSFGRCDNVLNHPEFDPWARDASLAGAHSGNWMKHMPWVNNLIQSLPESISCTLIPALGEFTKQKRTSREQVEKILNGDNKEWEGMETPTIFHQVLQSKLPPEEKSIGRLSDDAQMVVMAGTLTTAATLELIHFWLISQPETLRRLKDELRTVIPDTSAIASTELHTLENLPYLTAIIKEGLRLSYGVSTRLQRIDPDNPVVYTHPSSGKQTVIPAGIPHASTSVLIHQDERYFPRPAEFSPERWLGEQGKHLDKYLVSFCKGSRICLGINLAYAELYMALGAIWRSYGSAGVDGIRDDDDVGVMELYETTLRDVEIESDQFVPVAQKGSKGIRCMVRA